MAERAEGAEGAEVTEVAERTEVADGLGRIYVFSRLYIGLRKPGKESCPRSFS